MDRPADRFDPRSTNTNPWLKFVGWLGLFLVLDVNVFRVDHPFVLLRLTVTA